MLAGPDGQLVVPGQQVIVAAMGYASRWPVNVLSCRMAAIARHRRRDRVRVDQRARFAGRLPSQSAQDFIVPIPEQRGVPAELQPVDPGAAGRAR